MFYILFNSWGDFETDGQNYHLLESNLHKHDTLLLNAKIANPREIGEMISNNA